MIEPPLPGLHHAPRHRLGDEERGALVERRDGVVVLLGHLQERRRAVGAGVVHQHVERRLRFDRGADGGEVGHVEHQRLGAAAFVADLGGGGFDLGRGARRQHDMRAGLRQRGRGRQANAAAGAGDQSAAAVEPKRRRARQGLSGVGHRSSPLVMPWRRSAGNNP